MFPPSIILTAKQDPYVKKLKKEVCLNPGRASRLWQVAAVEYPFHSHPPHQEKNIRAENLNPPKYPPEAVYVTKNASKLKKSHPHSPNQFSHNQSIPCHNDVPRF